MKQIFKADALPVLTGSLPVKDHNEAVKIMLKYTPEIPMWAQLPVYPEERMMSQFLKGMPGLTVEGDHEFIDTEKQSFQDELTAFYEEYIAVTEGGADISKTRFALSPDVAKGFFTLIDEVPERLNGQKAVKGQITGPVTLAVGVTQTNGRSLFYDEQIRDAVVKLIALKAGFQVKKLSALCKPVIIFLDEPTLAGLGSSELISISQDEMTACFEEVFDEIHAQGGLAGVHVCANMDWSVVLESSADIINFDAYSYFEKFILYPDQIKAFIESGRILAWGIVPTQCVDDIERETVDSLVVKWNDQANAISKLGIDMKTILSQSLISPSCGSGTLSIQHAAKVLELTRGVSDVLRRGLK